MLLTKVKKILNSRPHHVSNQSNILFKLPKTPAQSKIKGEKRRKKKRKIERKEVATKKEKDYHIHRPLLVFFSIPCIYYCSVLFDIIIPIVHNPFKPYICLINFNHLKDNKSYGQREPNKKKAIPLLYTFNL
jgi:hypothetical protein